jgi:hypothetical protein
MEFNINSEKYDIGLTKKQTNKISSIELDQFDWNMLEIMDIMFGTFVEATSLISGSQYSTIGIAYFAFVQIREFLEDTNDIGINDMNLFIQLKQLLLKQIEKDFIEKDEQWEIRKVRFFVFLDLMKNLSYVKNYAYFDPIGYGCLKRRAVEVNIMDRYEQYVSQETDEEDPKEKSKPSSKSSMTKFLHSIGKKQLPSSFNIKSTTKNKLNEEMMTYRSLAQKEYNSIVAGDKKPDVVSAMELN